VGQFQTTIIDHSDNPVAATLFDKLTVEMVNDIEEQWSAKRSETVAVLGGRCFGIACHGEMQGLMIVSQTRQAQVPPDTGSPIIYVDYIESAPWNIRSIAGEPRFEGVGIRLVEAAIRHSILEGCKGRIGLHATPQAEQFYSRTCGMTPLGPDSESNDLPYFEMTHPQASDFIGENIP
jgi:hypothetical protein